MAPYDMKDKFKYNKYSFGEKFELAYAITTHLSQGSQYCNGIYMEEYLRPDINNNLNYTGITRFSNSLIYVKKKRKFY
jgi:ATP-dependent exoDNAse (exonuclease V) alpha subunit